jgi:ubiquinone/menaquinone biosynthesis C-methylase UbiE
MGLREWIAPRLLDWMMRSVDDLRPETVSLAHGEVLEVGFGTARNLPHYGAAVQAVTGLDPMPTEGLAVVEERIAKARFPVRRTVLRADGELPFDAGRFDCVLTTWTLCSIPDPLAALAEMRRILKPGGRYLFIEHGRSDRASTARWQERLNPLWRGLTGGCNMDRRMDALVEKGGFQLVSMDRFRAPGPAVLACMYRGVATREG